MKVRTDFVTNSSSSSFILAFDNNDRWRSYENFKDVCEDYEYDKLLSMIDALKEDSECTDKERALRMLYRYCCKSYIDENVRRQILESGEFYKRTEQLYESDEMRNLVEQDEEYIRKREEIENSDLVVMGEIWDTDGGLLEWAIRNGFLEDIFRNNCVLVWNVG